MKICRCGKRYSAAEWKKLVYVGVMEDEVERIELRNCTSCGSTIAVVLGSKSLLPEAT